MKRFLRSTIDFAALVAVGWLAYERFGGWGMVLAQALVVAYGCWCFWDGADAA